MPRNLESGQNGPKPASRACTNLFPLSTFLRSGGRVHPGVAEWWLFAAWNLDMGTSTWVNSRLSEHRASLNSSQLSCLTCRVWWRMLRRLRTWRTELPQSYESILYQGRRIEYQLLKSLSACQKLLKSRHVDVCLGNIPVLIRALCMLVAGLAWPILTAVNNSA